MNDKIYNVCCDYAALAHDGTCLRREHGEMIDRRGEDFESCKLFEEGEAEPDKNITFGKGARM